MKTLIILLIVGFIVFIGIKSLIKHLFSKEKSCNCSGCDIKNCHSREGNIE